MLQKPERALMLVAPGENGGDNDIRNATPAGVECYAVAKYDLNNYSMAKGGNIL
jgi:hypothetical protein